jgi:hypothetical protein
MTSIMPFITAKAVSAPPSGSLSGKGRVEKSLGNGTYVIDLPGGKITVECEPDALCQGDAVLLKMQGKELVIQRLDVLTGRTHQGSEEAFLLLLKNTDLPQTPPADSSKAIVTAQNIGVITGSGGKTAPTEGFYCFGTIEKALSWVETFSPGMEKNDRQKLLDAFADATPVVLQVVATENKGVKVLILPLHAAEARLNLFFKEIASNDLLNNFSPDGLIKLLAGRGVLSAQRLAAIDAMLPQSGALGALFFSPDSEGQEAIFSSIGKNGKEMLLNQWANIALDQSLPLSGFPAGSFLHTSAEIPLLLEKNGFAGLMAFSRPGQSDYTMAQSTFVNTGDKKGVVPMIFQNLGLELEHTLLSAGLSQESSTGPAPNLKQSIIKVLGETASLGTAPNQTILESYRDKICASTGALSSLWSLGSGKLLPKLIPSFLEQGLNIGKAVSEGPIPGHGFFDRAREWAGKAAEELNNLLSELTDAQKNTSSLIRDIEEALSKEENQAAFAQRLSPVNAGDSAKEVIAAISASVRSLALQSSRADEEITTQLAAFFKRLDHVLKESKSAQVFPENAISNQVGRASKDTSDFVPPLEFRSTIESAIKDFTIRIGRQLDAISGDIDKLTMLASQLRDKSDSAEALLKGIHSNEATKRLFEAVLQRIESIQIAAKPTDTAQGRQQVIVLPMKIDGRWNDVVMKFVRDKENGAAKNKSQTYFVAINVAPVFLGEINVSMSYSEVKECSIRMDFEKAATLSWFKENKTELVNALEALGFKTLKMDMQKAVHRKPSMPPLQSIPTTALDIVI